MTSLFSLSATVGTAQPAMTGIEPGRLGSAVKIGQRERLLQAMDSINDEDGELTIYFSSIHPVRDLVTWKIASLGMHRELQVDG